MNDKHESTSLFSTRPPLYNMSDVVECTQHSTWLLESSLSGHHQRPRTCQWHRCWRWDRLAGELVHLERAVEAHNHVAEVWERRRNISLIIRLGDRTVFMIHRTALLKSEKSLWVLMSRSETTPFIIPGRLLRARSHRHQDSRDGTMMPQQKKASCPSDPGQQL